MYPSFTDASGLDDMLTDQPGLSALFGISGSITTPDERGLGLGIAAGAASLSFLLSSLAPLVDWLDPWKALSPFYWAVGNGQLSDGLGWDGFGVLLLTTVVALIAAMWAFDHHDATG